MIIMMLSHYITISNIDRERDQLTIQVKRTGISYICLGRRAYRVASLMYREQRQVVIPQQEEPQSLEVVIDKLLNETENNGFDAREVR
jgi:hypothetical protein